MQHATFSPVDGILSNEQFLYEIANASLPIVTNNKKISYYNVPAAFDIEVSSFMQNGDKCACMYVWQFGILNWVTAGRTWDEFKSLLAVLSTILGLSNTRRLSVYIHNLAYEFQFMRKRFEWEQVFFLEERKPVYALTGGFEFRCSLKLSSKSLANVGKDLQKYKVRKLEGDLDYNIVRTSKTALTDKEWKYCENDIRVLLAYIMEKIEVDGDVTLIPMTNTGYVRNYCRKECFKRYKLYRGFMSELILDSDEYSQLKRGFAGGFTHASAKHSGKILSNVGSFDFTSSYPAVMVLEKFPMSRAKIIDSLESVAQLEWYFDRYCCLVDITFKNLVPKIHYEHPMSESKVYRSSGLCTDNGRVVAALDATTACTEQDYWVYKEFYDWDEIEVHMLRIYEKAYLPKSFVMAILNLYRDKTTLKDVDGEEINYIISKNMLNAAYGMTVTDIVRDIISYIDGEYSKSKPNINEAISQYNNSGKRFLFYPWGVWVTSYARANLFSGILACGNDYIYSDTDSIKILNPDSHMDYINAYNEDIELKISKAAEFHGIDPKLFSPCNKKGKSKTIGMWDFEGVYSRFKTLGAKRYIVEKEKDGVVDYTLTVAGVNKGKAMEYIKLNYSDPMNGLHDKLVVPKEYSGRLTLTYVDNERTGVVTDYLGETAEYNELSYIHMEPSDYELTISDDYKSFLRYINGIKEDSW